MGKYKLFRSGHFKTLQLARCCCCQTPNLQPSVCSLPPGLGVQLQGAGPAGGGFGGDGGRSEGGNKVCYPVRSQHRSRTSSSVGLERQCKMWFVVCGSPVALGASWIDGNYSGLRKTLNEEGKSFISTESILGGWVEMTGYGGWVRIASCIAWVWISLYICS